MEHIYEVERSVSERNSSNVEGAVLGSSEVEVLEIKGRDVRKGAVNEELA